MSNRVKIKNNENYPINYNTISAVGLIALFVFIIITVIIKTNGRYENIMDNFDTAPLYGMDTNINISASGNMIFKDMTASVVEDFENAKGSYGIDLTDGIDGDLNLAMLSSVRLNDNVMYINDYIARDFTSSDEYLEGMITNEFGNNIQSTIIYADFNTGELYDSTGLELGNFYSDPEAYSKINTRTIPAGEDIKTFIESIAMAIGKENIKVKKDGSDVYLYVDTEVTSDVISNFPDSFFTDRGISKYTVISSLKQIESKNDYTFPIRFEAHFVKNGSKYRIVESSFTGNLRYPFDKSFEEILALGFGTDDGNLPEDYRFGVEGNIDLDLTYKCEYIY